MQFRTRTKKLLLWGCSSLFTATTMLAATGPKIDFAEPIHDFGRLAYGTMVTNFFFFTNSGDASLVLSDVVSSCGCVAATNWDRRVEPGKTGIIPVVFSASGIGDNVTKPIRVVCNDPVESNAVLYVQAEIYKPIDAMPPIAMFRFGPDFQTNETRTIRLVSNLTEPVTLEQPVCTNSSFQTSLKTITPGKEFELSVTAIPPFGPGSWFAPVTVKSSSSKMSEIKVTAYVMVQPAMTVMPQGLMLSQAALAKPEELSVSIQNMATNSLVLSEPGIDAPNAQVQISEVQPGRLFEVKMSFPAGFRAKPGQKFTAHLKSNSPQSPLLKIPIMVPEDDTEAPPANAPAK